MVSNVEQRSTQRIRQTTGRQSQVNSQDSLDQEYDDIWPTRMPSSARRYYSGDISGRGANSVDPDSEEVRFSEYPSTRPGRRSSVPARSTASQVNVVTTQNKRTGGTQTSIPAAQMRRTLTQSNISAVQPRRTGTQSMPAVQTPRPTGTQTNLPALQKRRTTGTQAHVPAVQSNRQPLVRTDEIISRNGEIITESGQHKAHFHWLFYVGMAMLIMTLMWGALSALNSWWQVYQDDLHYGRPRTFQIDQKVGHNDSATPSHFIALNLNRHIEVIEFPGGDPSKAKIYIGPVLMGPGQDLAPATLEFRDVNGDGKPDMIVKVQDSRFVFINDNGSFRPLRSGEAVHL